MHLPCVARCAAALCGFTFAISSCSLDLSEADGSLPLVGEARDADRFPRINQDSVQDVAILKDDAGAIWAALYEAQLTLPGLGMPLPTLAREQVHLVRLDGPRVDEFIPCTAAVFGTRIAYVVRIEGDKARLLFIQPGQQGQGVELPLPKASGAFLTGPQDVVVLFQAFGDQVAQHRDLVGRTDGSFWRELPPRPVPQEGTTLRGSQVRAFDPSGDWLMRQDPDGRLWAYSSRDDNTVDLGIQDRMAGADDHDPVVYTCGKNGLIRLPIDSSPPTILERDPCLAVYVNPTYIANVISGRVRPHELMYFTGNDFYVIPKTGGARARLEVPPEGYLLAVGPQNQIVYSPDRSYHLNGLGEAVLAGRIGDWQFMHRGRTVSFSRDGARLHWLEDAARSDNTGELTGALHTRGDASVRLLARNVTRYDEITNGRLLAVSNAANRNLYSRVVLVNELEQRVHRVAEKSYDYELLPDRNEVLVKTRTNLNQIDLYRVPLP